MAPSHVQFVFAIPLSIVRSHFYVAQVKRPCSALFPWSWKADIQMLMLPTVAKADLPPFSLQTLQKTLPVKISNSIQSNLLYHASFHWLTTISNGVKPGWEVQPLENNDVWIKGVSLFCEFLYNILRRHFCHFAMWRQKSQLHKYFRIQLKTKYNRNTTNKKKQLQIIYLHLS